MEGKKRRGGGGHRVIDQGKEGMGKEGKVREGPCITVSILCPHRHESPTLHARRETFAKSHGTPSISVESYDTNN